MLYLPEVTTQMYLNNIFDCVSEFLFRSVVGNKSYVRAAGKKQCQEEDHKGKYVNLCS